jgi:hypothetical protein
MSIDRQTCILFARNDLQQLLDPFAPLRSHNAELRHVRPQSIDQLGPLPHQKVTRAMEHQPALLLGRFDLHKTHGRPPHRLADRLGVGGIVLVTLDVGLLNRSIFVFTAWLTSSNSSENSFIKSCI